jgi:hypothetical protein
MIEMPEEERGRYYMLTKVIELRADYQVDYFQHWHW